MPKPIATTQPSKCTKILPPNPTAHPSKCHTQPNCPLQLPRLHPITQSNCTIQLPNPTSYLSNIPPQLPNPTTHPIPIPTAQSTANSIATSNRTIQPKLPATTKPGADPTSCLFRLPNPIAKLNFTPHPSKYPPASNCPPSNCPTQWISLVFEKVCCYSTKIVDKCNGLKLVFIKLQNIRPLNTINNVININ